jgi:hypothetical protein
LFHHNRSRIGFIDLAYVCYPELAVIDQMLSGLPYQFAQFFIYIIHGSETFPHAKPLRRKEKEKQRRKGSKELLFSSSTFFASPSLCVLAALREIPLMSS